MAERRGIARPLANAAFPLTVGLLTLLAACSSPPSSPSAAATVAIPPAPTTEAPESTPSPTATKPPVATSTPTPTPTAAMTPTPQPKPTATALPLGPIAVLNGVVLRLELAISPSEKALGLGLRKRLPQDTGMLFVYGAEGGLTFWMKGMEFPIDILWLSREGTIVDISRDARPSPAFPMDSSPSTHRGVRPNTFWKSTPGSPSGLASNPATASSSTASLRTFRLATALSR